MYRRTKDIETTVNSSSWNNDLTMKTTGNDQLFMLKTGNRIWNSLLLYHELNNSDLCYRQQTLCSPALTWWFLRTRCSTTKTRQHSIHLCVNCIHATCVDLCTRIQSWTCKLPTVTQTHNWTSKTTNHYWAAQHSFTISRYIHIISDANLTTVKWGRSA